MTHTSFGCLLASDVLLLGSYDVPEPDKSHSNRFGQRQASKTAYLYSIRGVQPFCDLQQHVEESSRTHGICGRARVELEHQTPPADTFPILTVQGDVYKVCADSCVICILLFIHCANTRARIYVVKHSFSCGIWLCRMHCFVLWCVRANPSPLSSPRVIRC